MALITLEHAALAIAAIAGLGVALNAYVVLRINQLRSRIRLIPLKPGEALQASALLPLDLGEHASLAGSRCAAPGVMAGFNSPQDLRSCSNADRSPGLEAVGKLGALQEICNHCGSRLGTAGEVECHLSDGHRQVTGVDHLNRTRPEIVARHVDRHESDLQADRVLADQPHGVEHAERSAQHRDP